MLDTHQLERRSRPPHGDARVLVTGRIGLDTPQAVRSGVGAHTKSSQPRLTSLSRAPL
jgi:hypothetical protein